MEDDQDLVTQVLAPLRLRGAFLSRWSMCGPWAVRGEQEPCALLHYMRKGRAVIQIEGESPLALEEGDLAIFPLGKAHVIGDTWSAEAMSLETILPTRSTGCLKFIRIGKGEATTEMLCAGLDYEVGGIPPFYQLLPDILVVKASRLAQEPLLAHTLDGLLYEVDGHHDNNMVWLRGLELVYVLALRVALDSLDPKGEIALTMRHPKIGKALSAMNRDYKHKWRIRELADHAGMARSTFSNEFKRIVGETPTQHLIRRRLAEARRLLASTEWSHERIAEAIGYESVVGMHLAFQTVLGATPGTFRKQGRLQSRGY